MKWLIRNANFVYDNWKTVLPGGIIVVGVVIFLMGLFKKVIFNKIDNKMVRKTLLSFMSIVMVVPTTVLSVLLNNWSWNYFLALYILNCTGTIIVYWFYEGTHLRELLTLIGRNTVIKFLKNTQIEKILKETEEKSKYKDEDLKKL